MAIYEDFEDGNISDSEFTALDADFIAKSNFAYNGTYSGGIEDNSANKDIAEATPYSNGEQPDTFTAYFLETSSSSGSAIRLFNSNGNNEVSFASNNPQWLLDDGSGFNEIYGGDGYERWIEVKFTFDWSGGTYDYDITDLQSNHNETGTRSLNNAVDVKDIKIQNHTGYSYTSGSGHVFIDDISFTGVAVYPNEPTNPSPTDGATGVSTSTSLSVDVSHPEGDSMDVSFYWSDDTLIETVSNVSSGNTATTSSLSLSSDTTYEWYAVATSTVDSNSNTSSTFSFFTGEVYNSFNKKKDIDVRSVSGTPTVTKPLPLIITGNDDSTTGTGDIVIDWTNVSSKSDISFFDNNKNLLDYTFEEFDTSNNKAIAWIYNTWTRDGTTQLQVTYGDGSKDSSSSKSAVFGQETDLDAHYLLNESSGPFEDATGNGWNFTNNGASTGQTGELDGSIYTDGVDDYCSTGGITSTNNFTISLWIKTPIDISNQTDYSKAVSSSNTSSQPYGHYLQYHATGEIVVGFGNDNGWWQVQSGYAPPVDTWIRMTYTYDGSTLRYYVNGSLKGSNTVNEDVASSTDGFELGRNAGDDKNYTEQYIDNLRIHSKTEGSTAITAQYDATKPSQDFFSQQAGEAISTATNAVGSLVSSLSSTLSGLPTTSSTSIGSPVNIASTSINGLRLVNSSSSTVVVNSSTLVGKYPATANSAGLVVQSSTSTLAGKGIRVINGNAIKTSVTSSSLPSVGTIGVINVQGLPVAVSTATLEPSIGIGVDGNGFLVDITGEDLIGIVSPGRRIEQTGNASLALLVTYSNNDYNVTDSFRLASLVRKGNSYNLVNDGNRIANITTSEEEDSYSPD